MAVFSNVLRKALIKNQGSGANWAKGGNYTKILELTSLSFEDGSINADNREAFTGVESPTRIFNDIFQTCACSLEKRFCPDTDGILLASTIGAPVTTEVEAGTVYQHVFTLKAAIDQLSNSFALKEDRGAFIFELLGLKGNSWTLSGAGEDNPVTLKIDAIGKSTEYKGIPWNSGYQDWGFSACTEETSSTGLANDVTTYSFDVAVDGGAAQTITITGSNAQTISALISEINAQLTGATAVFYPQDNGYIRIKSNSEGSSSTIAITDTNLFSSLTNANANAETAVAGQTLVKPSIKDFYWSSCAFTYNGSVLSFVRNIELSGDNGLTQERSGSKYIYEPQRTSALPKIKFDIYPEDTSWFNIKRGATLQAFIWKMETCEIIGSNTHPSLTINIPKLYVTKVTPNDAKDGILTFTIEAEPIADSNDNYLTMTLVNKDANFTA